MRLNHSDIFSLPLAERQKLVEELRKVLKSDSGWKDAQEDIAQIRATHGYTDATTIAHVARSNFGFEGRQVKKGETVQLFPWQYAALTRLFKPVE